MLTAVALASSVAALLPARSAQACGGFFCNQPQNPFDLPVAQTAENVLFAMERTASGQFALEAHVQIFYTGPADRFSWVVPVDNQPTLGVGSNLVFSTLLAATRPSFNVDWRNEGVCKASPYPPPQATSPGAGGAADASFLPSNDGGAGVNVAFRGDVGPYDAAVIKSTSNTDAGPLLTWLNDNKYFVSPQAARLIEDYVREEKFFVAIRLLSDKQVGEIQPLVMKFLGPGPCVPLKLTSIAAIKDLRVNMWVLAQHRVVPDNFFELELNEARLDWFEGGSNYEQLLKEAADQANGHAFITEYAGPTAMLADRLYQPGRYNLDLIRQAPTPPDALDQIGFQGFPRDVTLLGILQAHIPLPEVLRAMGVDERTFYNQLRQYWSSHQSAFKPWNAAAMAADLDAKMVAPLRDAQALFNKHPKLTRLATFISPEEMTVDPTFVMNADLPDVAAARTAIAYRMCGDRQYDPCTAPVRLQLPSKEEVLFQPKPQGWCWDRAAEYERAGLDQLPALYKGYAHTTAGAGTPRFDNAAAIRSGLMARNAAVAQSILGSMGSSADGGVDGAGGAGGASGQAGQSGGSKGGGTGGSATGQPGGSGCSCDLGGGAPASAAGLPLGLAFALVVARRRRRR